MDLIFICLFIIFLLVIAQDMLVVGNRNYSNIHASRANILPTEMEKLRQQQLQRAALRRKMSLENEYCYIRLSNNAEIMTVVEKNYSEKHRTLTCLEEDKIPLIWNTLSYLFDSSSNYESVKRTLEKDFHIKAREQVIYDDDTKDKSKQYTDINNCSEKELRELPGINIIYAKRIIKRREEIGGFKDTEEFFGYIKVTDKIRDKLTKLICFNKFKEEKKAQKTKERNIDL